jgi:flagellin
MPLQVNTNTATIFAQNSLRLSLSQALKTQENLATGQRINSASDDPVYLAISEASKVQIAANNKALDSTQLGINVLATAEGGLNTILNNLHRMRELTVQAASDTSGQSQRNAIAQELRQLSDETDRIANTTTFNGVNLLNAVVANFYIQVGGDSTSTVDIANALGDFKSTPLGVLGGTSGFVAPNDIWNSITNTTLLTNSTVARNFLNDLDGAINTVLAQQTQIGAYLQQLDSTAESLTDQNTAVSEYNSHIRDTDFAQASSDLIQQNITRDASNLILAQTYRLSQSIRQILLK